MLSWKVNEENTIEIDEIEDDQEMTESGIALRAPFSALTTALVIWAKAKGMSITTDNPLITYKLPGARDSAFYGSSMASYVEAATFHDMDGSSATAKFDDTGCPSSTKDTLTALEFGENRKIERIELQVRVIEVSGKEHTETLDVEWLLWQAFNWSLRCSIARSADTESAASVIKDACAQILHFGCDLEANYTEILDLEAIRELELAYVCKNIERKIHNIRGAEDAPTHPMTVKAVMNLIGLSDDDIAAYLNSRRPQAEISYDPNKVILVDENYVHLIISESLDKDPSDFDVEVVTNMVEERFEGIEQDINELILECYEEYEETISYARSTDM